MSREITSPSPKVILSTSFDGKHKLAFNEATHRYRLNGKSCSGWTTIIKASYPTSLGLISWMQGQAATYAFEEGYTLGKSEQAVTQETKKEVIALSKKVHEKTAQEAADIGTITHSFAELHSLGKIEEANNLLEKVKSVDKWPIIESCIKKYLEWAKVNKGEFVSAEVLTASPTLHVSGKFDRLDRVNGKLRLRDYKTSKAIYPEQFVQLGGYIINIKEWLNLIVEEIEILRFGKEDGEFETLLINDPNEVQMFVAQAIRCKQTYDFKKLENDERFDWKKK